MMDWVRIPIPSYANFHFYPYTLFPPDDIQDKSKIIQDEHIQPTPTKMTVLNLSKKELKFRSRLFWRLQRTF